MIQSNSKTFSLWCDFLERDFINGRLKELVDSKIVNGATTNPSIFMNAFANSKAYEAQKLELKDLTPKEIYDKLVISDIKEAANVLKKDFQIGNDGFISIEIDPTLVDNAEASIKEAISMYDKLKMDNIMIKVPATDAGIEVLKVLVSRDINVNMTLIFSKKQVEKIIEALKGMKLKSQVVASVFISRFDAMLHEDLVKNSMDASKVGIYNAMSIYNLIESSGIKELRTLFASTGTKDKSLDKDYYIKELLLRRTINTAPIDTIEHYLSKNSTIRFVDSKSDEEIADYFEELNQIGIDIEKVADELLKKGIDAFKKSQADSLKLF